MVRKIWDYVVSLGLGASLFIVAVVAIILATCIICHVGALAISEATHIHPIQVRTTHCYTPFVVKITKPNGERLEATAAFEDASQEATE